MENEAKVKLRRIKIIHTIIWLVFVLAIIFVLWSGVTGNVSTYSWLAVLAVLVEGLLLLFFKGICPLTIRARKYSSSTRDNFDIYLPNWLAKYNKLIFTTIFCIGLFLMTWRYLMSR